MLVSRSLSQVMLFMFYNITFIFSFLLSFLATKHYLTIFYGLIAYEYCLAIQLFHGQDEKISRLVCVY